MTFSHKAKLFLYKTFPLNFSNNAKAFQLLLSLLFSYGSVLAQENTTAVKNSIYVELTKLRPVYSLNFDRVFLQGKTTQYSFRMGLAWTNDEFYVPIGISLLKGTRPNHLELSLVCGPYFRHYSALVRGVDDVDFYFYLQPTVGYRYQRWKAGPFIRLRAGPSITLDVPSERSWKVISKTDTFVFLSVGYSF